MGVFKIILALILILIISYVGASIYIASTLTIPGKTPLTYNKNNISTNETDVSFESTDGLKLKGWLFKGTNGKVIMFVHGAGSQNRANEVYGTPDISKYLIRQGYSVLLFDLRGTGESQYSRISFGEYESRDVAGAFNFLQTQGFAPTQIGIISDSLGAISTIMAADTVKSAGAIVLDSAATEVKTIVSNIMVNEHNVPRFLHPGIYLAAKLLFNIDVNTVKPIDKIRILKNTPLLFIYGEKDTLIPYTDSLELLSKVNEGTIVDFKDAGHIGSFKTNPQLYEDSITKFFKTNLK